MDKVIFKQGTKVRIGSIIKKSTDLFGVIQNVYPKSGMVSVKIDGAGYNRLYHPTLLQPDDTAKKETDREQS